MTDLLEILLDPPVRNRSKELAKRYGGKWAYDRQGTWWCDDNKRRVSRVNNCHCDDYCKHSPAYYLYGAGQAEQVYF